MKTIADRVVETLPFQTRIHIMSEGRHSPGFWGYFTKLAQTPAPASAVHDDMMRAAINQFDPKSYQETAAHWPVLRQKIAYVQEQIKTGKPVPLPRLAGMGEDIPGLVTSYDQLTASSGSGSSSGTDFWATFGNVLSNVVSTGTKLATTVIGNNTAKDIANIQAQAAQGIALTQAQQQQLQQAQLAAQGGSSSMVMYILLGLVGLGGLLLLFTLLKGRR